MKQWFILRVISGKEEKIVQLLKEKIALEFNNQEPPQIIIPTRKVTKFKKDGKITVDEKVYPGYIMIEVEPNDEIFKVISRTPGILKFGKKEKIPPPMSEEEVKRMLGFAKLEPTKITQMPYGKGDSVKIVDGPLVGFVGKVDEIFPDKQRIRIMVTIFGRQTPVEVGFSEVELV